MVTQMRALSGVPAKNPGEYGQSKKGRRTGWGKVLFGAVAYSESAVG